MAARLVAWITSPRKGALLCSSAGMTARALTARVRDLGAAVGLVGLSAHDLRHYWATRAARSGTPLDRLQDAGGWASPATLHLRLRRQGRRRCAAAVCGGGEDREPGGAAWGAGVARGG